MNEVQNFANFHTCYLPYGLKFFHKGHPNYKLNYSWPWVMGFYNFENLMTSSKLLRPTVIKFMFGVTLMEKFEPIR